MLLMFAVASLYPRRNRSPFLLASLLFLLANTNVHAAALVPLFVFIWARDWHSDAHAQTRVSAGKFAAAAALALLGIAVGFATVYPTVNDLIAASVQRGPPSRALVLAVVAPGYFVNEMLPWSLLAHIVYRPSIALATLALFGLTLGLVSRRNCSSRRCWGFGAWPCCSRWSIRDSTGTKGYGWRS